MFKYFVKTENLKECSDHYDNTCVTEIIIGLTQVFNGFIPGIFTCSQFSTLHYFTLCITITNINTYKFFSLN